MASTGKITNLNNNKLSNNHSEYLKTDFNDRLSDSEYEIEYIEKLKKTENMKIHKKPLEMSVWISDHFPIKISHFIPLIHILSYISTEFSELKSTLCSNFLPFQSFPLKISFPLGLSFYALLQVTSFTQKLSNLSIFEINYENSTNYFTKEITPSTSKNKKISLEEKQKNDLQFLDDKYAKDFYEKYYLEKKLDQNNSGLDQSSLFLNEKIREVFFTNSEEEIDNNTDNNSGYLNSNNFRFSGPNTLKQLNKIPNTVYLTENNFGFFNGDLNLDIEDTSDNKSNGGFPNSKTREIDLDITYQLISGSGNANNLALQEIKKLTSKKIYVCNNLKYNNNPLLNTQDFLEKEDEIPNEKDNFKKDKFIIKVPFTPTPRRKQIIDYSLYSKYNKNESQERSNYDSDDSQKTLKCSFKPKIMKNYKNFFKYKSNLESELQKANDLKTQTKSLDLKKTDSPVKLLENNSKSEHSVMTTKNLCIIF